MNVKINPHNWTSVSCTTVPICAKCGLMRLGNELTEMAVRCGCDHREHPDYVRLLRELKSLPPNHPRVAPNDAYLEGGTKRRQIQ